MPSKPRPSPRPAAGLLFCGAQPASCAGITHARQWGLVKHLAGGPAVEIPAGVGCQGLGAETGGLVVTPPPASSRRAAGVVCGDLRQPAQDTLLAPHRRRAWHWPPREGRTGPPPLPTRAHERYGPGRRRPALAPAVSRPRPGTIALEAQPAGPRRPRPRYGNGVGQQTTVRPRPGHWMAHPCLRSRGDWAVPRAPAQACCSAWDATRRAARTVVCYLAEDHHVERVIAKALQATPKSATHLLRRSVQWRPDAAADDKPPALAALL